MQLFFQENIDKDSEVISFNREESKHISKVLRKKEGDDINITNGNGILFKASLSTVTPNKCIATIEEVIEKERLAYSLHIAIAPTKANDRFEWFLEKATEIGITEITPLVCEHSERKVIKMERYLKILQNATKQSLRWYVPKLNKLTPFSEFIDKLTKSEEVKLIAHCENGDKTLLKNKIRQNERTLILIGPEGDFSKEEISLARKNAFTEITLGTSRLRTETAAIVACTNVAIINTK